MDSFSKTDGEQIIPNYFCVQQRARWLFVTHVNPYHIFLKFPVALRSYFPLNFLILIKFTKKNVAIFMKIHFKNINFML